MTAAQHLLFSAVLSAALSVTLANSHICQSAGFRAVHGFLCIHSEFSETLEQVTQKEPCAFACEAKENCQAFSMADGSCQLFVFNRCSKSVRNCTCSRTGQVFVKKQTALHPGMLCPSGYGDNLCGVKYKKYSGSGSWTQSRQKCGSENGLVIMADVTSSAEMEHVNSITSGSSVWLGGSQAAGSAEPSGGWSWSDCDIPVNSGLWANGEPDNSNGGQDKIARYSGKLGLTDLTSANIVLCECLSPFE